jgi:glyceraldehyde-3-phosphate dehydrogenase (NADP+)
VARCVQLVSAVDALRMGLPWQDGVKITPLPEADKPAYLQKVIAEAVSKGAKVLNPRGATFDRTFVAPSVVFPVTRDMELYWKEQFGPVIPVATFHETGEIHQYLDSCEFGQQAAVFGQDHAEIAGLIDVLVNVVCRVNLNSQCQRGPDFFPFTGRKNSAAGTLSVHDALRVFSIRSMVACQQTPKNTEILNGITRNSESKFLRLDHLF